MRKCAKIAFTFILCLYLIGKTGAFFEKAAAEKTDADRLISCAYTTSIDYGEGERKRTIRFDIPKIELSGDSIKSLNSEIYELIFSDIEQIKKNLKVNGILTSRGISYEWNVCGDILSLVVTDKGYIEIGVSPKYYVYNVSISERKSLTREEFCEAAGYTDAEYTKLLTDNAGSYFWNGFERDDETFKSSGFRKNFNEQLFKTISADNIADGRAFFNSDGHLSSAVRIYSLAGPDSLWYLTDLEANVEGTANNFKLRPGYDIPAGFEMQAVHSGDDLTELSTQLKNVSAGDTVYFGEYRQSGSTKLPIEWLVLERSDKGLLVISRYCLDCQAYNTERENITWENCTLRAWLNKEFLEEAFSDSLRAVIADTNLVNSDNANYGTDGGEDTVDKIFLLSIDEVKQYFSSNEARKATVTDYALSQGAGTWMSESDIAYDRDGNETHYWWLRSPGKNSVSAASVRPDGSVYDEVNYVEFVSDTVRPALWIDLEALAAETKSF